MNDIENESNINNDEQNNQNNQENNEQINNINFEKYDPISLQFYLMYHLLLKTKNEKQYVVCLSQFTESIKLNDFAKIDNIKSLIFNLKSENLFYAYKMTLLVFAKCEKSMEAALIFGVDSDCNTSFIVNKLTSLKNDSMYIDSYKIIPLSIKPLGEQMQLSEQITYECDDNCEELIKLPERSWYFETRIDIFNRFEYLRNYFGLKRLQDFKIKNTTYDEVYNMSFKKLVKFHNKIIEKIKKGIKKSMKLCQSFIDIEKTFISALMSPDNIDILNNTISDPTTNGAVVNNFDINLELDLELNLECELSSNLNLDSDSDSDFGFDSDSDINNSNFESNDNLVCNVGLDLNQFDNHKYIESFDEFNKFNELDKILFSEDFEDDVLDEEL